MQKNKDNLLFSSISGYNMYLPSNNTVFDLVHFFSKEYVNIYKIKGIDINDIEKKWRYFIENPIYTKNFLWPIDIVTVDDDNFGFIFKKKTFPKMEKLKKILYTPEVLSAENQLVKKIIKNILTAFIQLHSAGYAYHSFDIDRIYYNESTGEILFDFSLAMSFYKSKKTQGEYVFVDDVKIEFLPPWRTLKNDEKFYMEDDYYSIAALLFRMLTGRMPYQGRFMDGLGDIMVNNRDIDPDMHIKMFNYYHENPLFIFDETDNRNSIGIFSEEEKIIDKWINLPTVVKNMFLQSFSKKNIDKDMEGKRKLFSAQEWYDILMSTNILLGD